MSGQIQIMQILGHQIPLPAYDRVIELYLCGKNVSYIVTRICRIGSLKEEYIVDELVRGILEGEGLLGYRIPRGLLSARCLREDIADFEQAHREAVMFWEQANMDLVAARKQLERVSIHANNILLKKDNKDCDDCCYFSRRTSGQVSGRKLKKGFLPGDPILLETLNMELDAMEEVRRMQQVLQLRELAF